MRLSPGSDAVQVPAEIGVDPGDIVLAALPRPRADDGTQLDPILRNLGVTTIVGVGVSLNVGMTNLAFDAVNRGYQIVLPRDAVAGVPPDYAEAVLANTLEHRRDAHDDRRRRRARGVQASGSPRRGRRRSRRSAPGSRRARLRRRPMSGRGRAGRFLGEVDRVARRGQLRPPRRGNRMHAERHGPSVSRVDPRDRGNRGPASVT